MECKAEGSNEEEPIYNCRMECEDKTCLRIPIPPRMTNVLPWEVFVGPARDQWTESGRYDYSLAIKLLECFGCDPPEIMEAVDRMGIITTEVQRWSKLKSERETEAEDFKQQAKGKLGI